MERRAAYIYSPEIEKFNYGPEQLMKPKKIAMTHDILQQSEVLSHFDLYSSYLPSQAELEAFHSRDYVEFIRDYFDNKEQFKRVRNIFKLFSGCSSTAFSFG
jgi:acetoin utilization deacetylase AcuC-like enzyme